jgi:hypothetical protein
MVVAKDNSPVDCKFSAVPRLSDSFVEKSSSPEYPETLSVVAQIKIPIQEPVVASRPAASKLRPKLPPKKPYQRPPLPKLDGIRRKAETNQLFFLIYVLGYPRFA